MLGIQMNPVLDVRYSDHYCIGLLVSFVYVVQELVEGTEGSDAPKPKKARTPKVKAPKSVAKTPAAVETTNGEETGTETVTSAGDERGEKKEIPKKKAVKKIIPSWANVSDKVKTTGVKTSSVGKL